MLNISELQNISTQVRRDIIRMVNGAKSGHPGGSLGCSDFLTALYFNIMDYDPKNFSMNGENEDLFFLSIGHISPAFYSILARAGFFEIPELASFRKINTRLQGHPCTHDGLPGIRIASGSLGQGLSVAIGAALSKKLNNDDHLIYSLHGDGELEEGQIWEAAMFAAAKKVDNIISTVDYNGQQIDGRVEDVLDLGDLNAKWEAFGWIVLETEGNNISRLIETLNIAKEKTGNGKPVVILMKTEMGFGVDFMQGTNKWHGNPPNDEQAKIALNQLQETIGDY